MIWPFGAGQKEARRLNKDAAGICASATQTTPVPELVAIADLTAESIRESLARAGDTAHLKPAISHFRMLHGEARRGQQQKQLTAYTLVIIYLSALRLEDERGRPAIETIDGFIAEHGSASLQSKSS